MKFVRSFGRLACTLAAALTAAGIGLAPSRAHAEGEHGFWRVQADGDVCVAAAPIQAGGGFALMASDGELSFMVSAPPKVRSGRKGVIATNLDSFEFEPHFDDDLVSMNGWMTAELIATLRLATDLWIGVDKKEVANLQLKGSGFGEVMDAVLECSRGRSGWWGEGAVLETVSSEGPQALSGGTAFFIAAGGLALTNHHVVAGCTSVSSPRWGTASVLAIDERADLALIRTERASPMALNVRQRGPRLSEPVLVAGYPLTSLLGSGLKVTNGVVSGLSGLEGDRSMFQLTAPIQPGNSGGPVTDADGALIGVVAAKLDEEATLSATGTLPQNVNFAVSGPVVQAFLEENGVPFATVEGPNARRDLTQTTFFVECSG